jgi:hypothetical protein
MVQRLIRHYPTLLNNVAMSFTCAVQLLELEELQREEVGLGDHEFPHVGPPCGIIEAGDIRYTYPPCVSA